MNIAIVLAGGVGARVGASIPKQFIRVLGKPIMVYTLEAFEKCESIDRIVLVCVKTHMETAAQLVAEYNLKKVTSFVCGGDDFLHSCINGLDSLKGICADDDTVVITSADRPFLSLEEIEDSIRVCKEHGSGIAARPCSLCMFRVGNDRTHSGDYLRNSLMQTATPWTFHFGGITRAIDKYLSNELPPCESYPVAIYAASGREVYFSLAKAENIKITEPHDIMLMEQMLIRMRGNTDES